MIGVFASSATTSAARIVPPGGPAPSLAGGFSPQRGGAWYLASAFSAPAPGDDLASSHGEIATPATTDTPYLAGELAGETSDGPSTGAKPDAGLDNQFWASFDDALDSHSSGLPFEGIWPRLL